MILNVARVNLNLLWDFPFIVYSLDDKDLTAINMLDKYSLFKFHSCSIILANPVE